VLPTGGKIWRFKYRFAGKERVATFGAYPVVTLAMARDLQIDAQRFLMRNVDPGEVKKQERRALMIAAADSYEAVARERFVKFSVHWAPSHSLKVLLRLENDLFPWLGSPSDQCH
jgi:Arm DNA-binding domain